MRWEPILRCCGVAAGVVSVFILPHFLRMQLACVDQLAGPTHSPLSSFVVAGMDPLSTLLIVVPISKVVAVYSGVVFAFRIVTFEIPFFDVETMSYFAVAVGTAIADTLDWECGLVPKRYGTFALASLVVAISAWYSLVRGQRHSEEVMAGKTVVITGSNTGIGYETAKELARMGATVIMACRSKAKADIAIGAIQRDMPAAKLIFVPLDVSSFESVESFVHEISSMKLNVHVLINNAGVLMTQRRLNRKGHEMMIATNHLGPFLLTKMMLPILLKNPKSRIINVSSSTHHIPHALDFKTLLTSDEQIFSTFDVYAKTKFCNIISTVELHRRYHTRGLDAFSVHPGTVVTEVTRDMGIIASLWGMLGPLRFLLVKSASAGAYTSICAASDRRLDKRGGQYLMHCHESKFIHPFATDRALGKKLWEWSETHTDLTWGR